MRTGTLTGYLCALGGRQLVRSDACPASFSVCSLSTRPVRRERRRAREARFLTALFRSLPPITVHSLSSRTTNAPVCLSRRQGQMPRGNDNRAGHVQHKHEKLAPALIGVISRPGVVFRKTGYFKEASTCPKCLNLARIV